MVVPNTTLGKTKEAFIDATCPMIWLMLTKVYIPPCSHVFWRTFSKGDAFIGYHDDIVPAVVLQVCAELHSDGVFLSDEERKSWEEKVSRTARERNCDGYKENIVFISYVIITWTKVLTLYSPGNIDDSVELKLKMSKNHFMKRRPVVKVTVNKIGYLAEKSSYMRHGKIHCKAYKA